MNIKKLIIIHELIRKQRTGKPKALASRLGVSERTIYHYISFMKTELRAPVKWYAMKESYVYESNGKLNFEWQD
jgi:predicted DNA-binding transcriptional regulator YafY